MTPTERQNLAIKMFAQYPEFFPEEHRDAILNGQIQIGMSPYEAHLAGGSFSFKVVADAAYWPKKADPYKVMWAQSKKPDESEIWMTFKNKSQYQEESERMFRVYFRAGRAVEIEKDER